MSSISINSNNEAFVINSNNEPFVGVFDLQGEFPNDSKLLYCGFLIFDIL